MSSYRVGSWGTMEAEDVPTEGLLAFGDCPEDALHDVVEQLYCMEEYSEAFTAWVYEAPTDKTYEFNVHVDMEPVFHTHEKCNDR